MHSISARLGTLTARVKAGVNHERCGRTPRASFESMEPPARGFLRPSESDGFGGDKAQQPQQQKPGYEIEREEENQSRFIVWNSRRNMSLKQQRQLLPIYQYRRQFLYCVERYPTTIIVGQTGSGKTTQVPQYLHEAGWTAGGKQVACTQPRRVAATTVAQRVAEEMGTELGNMVGYAIRFDECYDHFRTRIKYLTDGMLVRETMLDPLLSHYSVIMIDEAHERSLHTDILVGLLRKIQKKRTDLRVIISSATLDAQMFKDFFEDNRTGDPSKDTAVILGVEGRQYPVQTVYTKDPVRDYIRSAVETVFRIHKSQGPGDILLFLTGREEIDKVVTLLGEGDENLLAYPLYAGLPPRHQVQVFKQPPKGCRKVIVATNVAETSLTIDGIVFVVDCGFAKLPSFDSRASLEQLLVTPISQASANQRAGRAGRTCPGQCFRLYTEDAFHKTLSVNTIPEMQRCNLASVVLQLKALGIDDVLHFDFLSPPPIQQLSDALELLFACGALDEYCKLTSPVGTILAEFPVEPRIAKMLIASGELECSEEVLSLAAMLSVQSVFIVPRSTTRQDAEREKRRFSVVDGDHLTLLNVYNAYVASRQDQKFCQEHFLNPRALKRAVEIRRHLRRYMTRFKIPMVSCEDNPKASELVKKSIVSGFFSNAAQLQSNAMYRTVKGAHLLAIHPSSVLLTKAPQWVVYHEVVLTSEKFMRELTVIEPMWLAELAPHYYEYKPNRDHQQVDEKEKKKRERQQRKEQEEHEQEDDHLQAMFSGSNDQDSKIKNRKIF